MTNELPTIDREQIAMLQELARGGKKGLLEELIDIFALQSAERLADLRQAASQGNPKRMELVAHQLKGSALMLGLPMVALISGEIETSAYDGRHGDAAARLPMLEDAVALACAELQELLLD